MNTHGLPCRRCGQVGDDVVTIYGRDEAGALLPRTAQCRGQCKDPQQARSGRSSPGMVVTAFRPGKCAACTWDIVPGDKIVNTGQAFVHFECAPAEEPSPQPERRERGRTRGAGYRGREAVVV